MVCLHFVVFKTDTDKKFLYFLGIQPKNQDWETDDCLHFQRLTVDKQFASQVHVATTVTDGSVMLELTLIDVSNETDIYINGLLIEDERAVSVN